MVDPGDFAAAERAYVEAAAGCGKTELIADAAAATKGRSLILTHTHAGVGALRSRLRTKAVSPDRYSVQTLDGFALRFASAYPATSGWHDLQPSSTDWPRVQAAATSWLQTTTAEQVLRASYDGVYVDEYQDCTGTQHALVSNLAEILPVRVVGDPLQGIFDFVGDPLDWELVRARYPPAGVLEEPHRWARTNPPLGEWLLDARKRLQDGDEPEWTAPVVSTRRWSMPAEIDACNRLRDEQSVVAIRKYPSGEHDVASKLGGAYVSMEPIASRALFDAVGELEGATGSALALATIDVAARCMTAVNSKLRAARRRLEADELPVARDASPVTRTVSALRLVVTEGIGHVPDALDAIEELCGVPPHRQELLHDIRRSIRSRAAGSDRNLKDIAWDLREEARRRGRSVPSRIVSRTLLVKGLEFDHAIVLRRRELSTENLYVAITRPRRSLTVLL